MAPEAPAMEEDGNADEDARNKIGTREVGKVDGRSTDGEEEEDEDEEEDEPRLKYASLTQSLKPVYRNGDATSTFMVAGDKMIVGTHNGNIYCLAFPSLQLLRMYHAHSASISTISISPCPPPLAPPKADSSSGFTLDRRGSPASSIAAANISSPSSRNPIPATVPRTASNSIHIATASIDGNVCVASLVNQKDTLQRNFGRPVQAVALSPDYKNDRSYLSGGLAGNLVLTTGGQQGTRSTSSTTGGAAAAAGWLGSIGLGPNTAKDTILHSGEGTISVIRWSLSGKFVVWVNEKGIKIMRSNTHLESAEGDLAWKRMNHIDHPNRAAWDDMSGVWKPRVEWIDEAGLETDDIYGTTTNGLDKLQSPLPGTSVSKLSGAKPKRKERLLVGWGDTIWIIDVYPGAQAVQHQAGEKKIGHVEIITMYDACYQAICDNFAN